MNFTELINITYDFVPKITHTDYIFAESESFFSLRQLKDAVEKRLNDIPEVVLRRFTECGWSCVITNQRNLESEYGYKYHVYGVTDYLKKQIIVYAEPEAIKFSLPHELGHFLDYVLGNITKSGHWIKVFNYDSQHIPACKKDYFPEANIKEEFFADAFLLYCDSKLDLKRLPDTFKVITRSIEALEYVKESNHSIIV